MHSDVGNGLTEERRALIGRYMIDAHAPPVGAEREEPMRRKAAEDRARREALEAVVRRAAAAEAQARRQAEEERARYEALQAAARRATAERAPRQAGAEPTTRLVDALTRLQASSDATAMRLERLTWALVLLSISIAAFTTAVLARV